MRTTFQIPDKGVNQQFLNFFEFTPFFHADKTYTLLDYTKKT